MTQPRDVGAKGSGVFQGPNPAPRAVLSSPSDLQRRGDEQRPETGSGSLFTYCSNQGSSISIPP